MRARQLSDLRQAAAWLADIPTPTSTTGITLLDANAQINAGVAEVMNLIISAVGDTAYRKSQLITTQWNQTVYPLALDFYELKSAERAIDASNWLPLERFTAIDRPYLISSSPGWSGSPYRYCIQGKTAQDGSDPGSIELLPLPAPGTIIRLWYIFGPQLLVNDTDSFDGFAGFEDYAVNYAARRFALKMEEYELADRLGAEMERLRQIILGMIKQRDGFSPPRVQMTREESSRGRWGRRRVF